MYTGLGVAVCDEEKRGLESHLFFFFLPTCPPGVLIIWLRFDVGFEFLFLIAHIHPPVSHYLLLVESQTNR